MEQKAKTKKNKKHAFKKVVEIIVFFFYLFLFIAREDFEDTTKKGNGTKTKLHVSNCCAS